MSRFGMAVSRSSPSLRALLGAALLALAAVATVAAAQAPTPRGPASRPSAQAPAPRGGAPTQAALDRAVTLDRVIAIVNDEALTQFELNEQKRAVLEQMRAQKVQAPPNDVLEKQLLERLITERALLQLAKETGVRVDDVQVERTIQRIAQENKLTPDQLRQALEREGVSYAKYRDDLRNEITIQRLRDREVDARISVSDAEVDAFLATASAQTGGDAEYRLAHILVLVPEQATPEQIDAKRRRADEALKQVRDGADFAQVAAGYSDAPDALQGGNLGWRAPARLPTVFADTVRTLQPGQVSGVLRSASGFHIVKLLEVRDRNQPTVIDQTRARHILVKVNEITSDSEAKTKIDRIRDRIERGAKFDDQAKLNSEDASAAKGGDLGWLSPGDTVPDFERAMNALKIGDMSAPVRTPFGWHLILVTERRTQDVTAERQREQARAALRQRKSDEAFQDWVRQVRDRAYVEYKADER
jgi:peptidyl-prolyl cis-trans isomerase SurA